MRALALVLFMSVSAYAATPADILEGQMIRVAQMQSPQDIAGTDIPFVGDSIIAFMRVKDVLRDAVNRGSAGARGHNVCQMIRQVSEFQTRRAALVHVGTNDAGDILGGIATIQHWRNRVNCILAYATIPLVWAETHQTAYPNKNAIIDQLNLIAKEACEARDVPCVWVPSPWVQFRPDYFPDGTHPNALGYAAWKPDVQAGFAALGINP